MITDIKKGKYGIEGKAFLKLFNTEVDISIDGETDVSYAEKCVEAFNKLSDKTVSEIWKAAKNYCLHMIDICEDFSDEMTVEITEDTPAEKIKPCFSPIVFIVDEPENDKIGYHIECDCDWEPEHGLELTFLDGKLIYAGAFEDRGAWEKYDEDDDWNFVNSL